MKAIKIIVLGLVLSLFSSAGFAQSGQTDNKPATQTAKADTKAVPAADQASDAFKAEFNTWATVENEIIAMQNQAGITPLIKRNAERKQFLLDEITKEHPGKLYNPQTGGFEKAPETPATPVQPAAK